MVKHVERRAADQPLGQQTLTFLYEIERAHQVVLLIREQGGGSQGRAARSVSQVHRGQHGPIGLDLAGSSHQDGTFDPAQDPQQRASDAGVGGMGPQA